MTEEKDNIEMGETKTCPYCHEMVNIKAIKCKHCSADISVVNGTYNYNCVGQQNVSALFNSGMYNKSGFLVTVVIMFSLFLPVVDLPYLGVNGLINSGAGVLLFVLLIILSIFFYGGATRKYIHILTVIVFLVQLYEYNHIISLVDAANYYGYGSFFEYVKWGILINIAAYFMLFRVAFINEYIENDKSI